MKTPIKMLLGFVSAIESVGNSLGALFQSAEIPESSDIEKTTTQYHPISPEMSEIGDPAWPAFYDESENG